MVTRLSTEKSKPCIGCGRQIIRGLRLDRKGQLESITLWNRKKYCSVECMRFDPEYRARHLAGVIRAESWKANIGRTRSIDAIEAQRAKMIGHSRGGWKLSPETRRKMSASRKKGAESPLWRGGLTSANASLRSSSEYKIWRDAVFVRDNWTCQLCGKRGVPLHADHIKAFSSYPDLRFSLENGRTLCVPCHKETDTYLWKSAKFMALHPEIEHREI